MFWSYYILFYWSYFLLLCTFPNAYTFASRNYVKHFYIQLSVTVCSFETSNIALPCQFFYWFKKCRLLVTRKYHASSPSLDSLARPDRRLRYSRNKLPYPIKRFFVSPSRPVKGKSDFLITVYLNAYFFNIWHSNFILVCQPTHLQ